MREADMSQDIEYQTLRQELLDEQEREFKIISFASRDSNLLGFGATNSG